MGFTYMVLGLQVSVRVYGLRLQDLGVDCRGADDVEGRGEEGRAADAALRVFGFRV